MVVTLFYNLKVSSNVLTLECGQHIVSPHPPISNMAFISVLTSQETRARDFEILDMKLKI